MPTEPFDDKELNSMLQEWKAPPAPAHLRAAIFPEAPWWQRLLRAELRIPVPLAAAAILLLFAGIWLFRPAPSPPPSTQLVTFRELRPVNELKPRIIRRTYE
jgi:hypothetical protein